MADNKLPESSKLLESSELPELPKLNYLTNTSTPIGSSIKFEYKAITYPMSIISEISLKKETLAPLPNNKICVPINLSNPMDSIKIQGLPDGVEFQIGMMGVTVESESKIHLYTLNTRSNQGILSMDQKEFYDWTKTIGGNSYMEHTQKHHVFFGESTYLVFDREEIKKCTNAHYFTIIITVNMCNVIESWNDVSFVKIRKINYDKMNDKLNYDDTCNPLYCSLTHEEILANSQKLLKQTLYKNKCLGCLTPYSKEEKGTKSRKIGCMCNNGHYVCLECWTNKPDALHWKNEMGPEHSLYFN
jgi:hypothetical protein